MNKIFSLNSAKAFVIYVAVMFAAFVFATAFPKAPFLAFASWLTPGFGAYVTKRHYDKRLNLESCPPEAK